MAFSFYRKVSNDWKSSFTTSVLSLDLALGARKLSQIASHLTKKQDLHLISFPFRLLPAPHSRSLPFFVCLNNHIVFNAINFYSLCRCLFRQQDIISMPQVCWLASPSTSNHRTGSWRRARSTFPPQWFWCIATARAFMQIDFGWRHMHRRHLPRRQP